MFAPSLNETGANLFGGMYNFAMNSRVALVTLLLILHSAPAVACSWPPDISLPATNEEFSRAVYAKIDRSDVVVDAIVSRSEDGTVFLKPIKVWKGERQRKYMIGNDGCGVFLPVAGGKVRVLLYKMDSDGWVVAEPVVGGKSVTLNFDSVLDSRLGDIRSGDFQSVGPLMPPPPKAMKRK
ncbi:MAG: hypothetical protein J0I25_11980 [Sphingomonadales bacterium]|nr:hypothetical protein [Sphingomonadales bacterium]